MKRLLQFALLLTALAWCVPAHATISVIERKNATAGSCSAGLTITLTTNTVAGELIVVAWSGGTTGGAVTLTDSASQTYTKVWELTSLNGNYATGVAYKANSASGVSSVKVTGTTDSLCTFAELHATGIATTSPVDQTSAASATGVASPWSSGTVTTTQATELLIGQAFAAEASGGSCVMAASGSWTGTRAGPDGNGNDQILEDQEVTSIQTNIAATGTTGTCTTHGGGLGNYPGIVTFLGAGATTVQGPPWYKLPTSGPSWVISILIGIMIGASGYGLPKVSDRCLVRDNISSYKSLLESVPIELWKTPDGVYEALTVSTNKITKYNN